MDTSSLDKLVLLDETDNLTEDEVRKLFPDYDEDDTEHDRLVNEMFVENYAYRRSTGLSAKKSMNVMGYSGMLLSTLLTGKGLSLGRFVALASAELFADAEFQGKNLEILFNSANGKSPTAWQAAASSLANIELEKEKTNTVPKFVGCPTMLSLALRQELSYRYQYLEDTIEKLSNDYKLDEEKLKSYIKENSIERKKLETEEDVEAFEAHVNTLYKSLQIRMIGVTALNTAKSWESLADSEESLLKGLKNAAKEIASQSNPDSKTLTTLANTHAALTNKHALIQESAANAGDIISAIKSAAGWDIEVTHVDFKPKENVAEVIDE